ncbi:MAG TPA: endonuclease/exonuclease/phosphatase family protein [Nitrospiraceae bacterium]|nr:endonuclease/exonuclease/phosphatase family protein [Nitrospiraceae bacterium]
MLTPELEIDTGSFASPRWYLCPPSSVKAVCWNINRGLQLPRILEFLSCMEADILLLQEVDLNARRTHHIHIAREIAQKLQLNYVFGREFRELTQGTSHSPAYHGQATLSHWPLSNARILRFQQQSNFWKPRWFLPEIEPFQERVGGRLALVADACIGGRTITTYNLHLESRGDDRLRRAQMEETLRDAHGYKPNEAVVLAGDFNMDVSAGDVARLIRNADFQDAFENQHIPTTPNSFFTDGRMIDWIFSRGPLRSGTPKVHRSITGSDHYPLSVTLDFR